jgi:hypothetical protein
MKRFALCDTRIGDADRDGATLGNGASEPVHHRGLIRDVHRERVDAPARDLVEHVFATSRDRHLCTGFRQSLRDRKANARTAARDQCVFAI